METQRHFATAGNNLFKIVLKLSRNQKICRLLKYQSPDALNSEKYENVNGIELIHNQINIVPKYPESGNEYSFVTAVFDDFVMNPNNSDYIVQSIRFDIACPLKEWIINGENLRPYIIMQEIDTMFNRSKLDGIGTLSFISCQPLTLSPQLAGYSMVYGINVFN